MPNSTRFIGPRNSASSARLAATAAPLGGWGGLQFDVETVPPKKRVGQLMVWSREFWKTKKKWKHLKAVKELGSVNPWAHFSMSRKGLSFFFGSIHKQSRMAWKIVFSTLRVWGSPKFSHKPRANNMGFGTGSTGRTQSRFMNHKQPSDETRIGI